MNKVPPPEPVPEPEPELPDNVVMIKQTMIFDFMANAPLISPAEEDRLQCRRYELRLCRECSRQRGEFTPFCEFCYPYDPDKWKAMT